VPTSLPQHHTLVFASTNWGTLAQQLPPVTRLSSRDNGHFVTDHRSSWVRRITLGDRELYIKSYEYASWSDRLRNWGRWTAPGRSSRAAREYQALTWLREHGFSAPLPLCCIEWRSCSFLVRATLVTSAEPGRAANLLLQDCSPADRQNIASAIGRFVCALHRSGFRDRNLDLRNLLIHQRGSHYRVAKIDSPRHRIVAAGRANDRLAAADWQRLLPQLAEFGVAQYATDEKAKQLDE
jgi:hypothetical protein